MRWGSLSRVKWNLWSHILAKSDTVTAGTQCVSVSFRLVAQSFVNWRAQDGWRICKMDERGAGVCEQVYRHLYDTSMQEHRDSQMAQNSWREIAATIGKR